MKLLGYQLLEWIHSGQCIYDRCVINDANDNCGFGIWLNYKPYTDGQWHLNFSNCFKKKIDLLYNGPTKFASVADGQQAVNQYLEQLEKLKAFC